MSPVELLAASRGRDFDGYGGIGDYARAHGNMFEALTEGHKIRDGVYDRVRPPAIDDAGAFDCVVVGGGISGLAAALFFARQAPGRSCLVLEDHAMFGGEARPNEFSVGGQHLVAAQASALFPPLPGTFLAGFYPSIGIEATTFEYQTWGGVKAELPLGTAPYYGGGPSSAYYFGEKFGQRPGLLLKDPMGTQLATAPISEEARRELLALAAGSGPRAKPQTHGRTRVRFAALDRAGQHSRIRTGRELGPHRDHGPPYVDPGS